jgi:hypothetical protein
MSCNQAGIIVSGQFTLQCRLSHPQTTGEKQVLDQILTLNIPERTVHIFLSREELLMSASISIVIFDAVQINRRIALEVKDGVCLTLSDIHSTSN